MVAHIHAPQKNFFSFEGWGWGGDFLEIKNLLISKFFSNKNKMAPYAFWL